MGTLQNSSAVRSFVLRQFHHVTSPCTFKAIYISILIAPSTIRSAWLHLVSRPYPIAFTSSTLQDDVLTVVQCCTHPAPFHFPSPHTMLQQPQASHRGSNADVRNQIKMRRKKNVKKGIQFCMMVCGASGTGELYHYSVIRRQEF